MSKKKNHKNKYNYKFNNKQVSEEKTEQLEIFSLDNTAENPVVSDAKVVSSGDVSSIKPKKEKLSKYEKRKQREKKHEALLNMRGIPKFWSVLIFETFYIFLVEIVMKLIIENFVFDYSLLRIFLSSAILSLVMTVVSVNMPLKIRRGILIAFNFFIVLYAWLQIGFLNYIGAFMSLGNASQGTKIGEFVVDFLSSYTFLRCTIWIPFIISLGYFWGERYITKDGFEKKLEFKWFVYDAALIVYLALLCFGYYITLEVDFMQGKFQTVSNKALFKYPSNPALTVKNFGTTMFFFLDVKGMIVGEQDMPSYGSSGVDRPDAPVTNLTRKIDDEAWEELMKIEDDKNFVTLNNYFINRTISDKNDYTGKFKNKNLIMIMLESVGEVVFHDEYKEFFPTLNKLYHEGITAENNYSPRNNCSTGESEFTSVTSLYTIETTCTVNTYKKNEYKQALLYMLRNNGYYTSAYHDWDDQYYARSVFETKLGSYRYYDIDDLKMKAGSSYGSWPSDVEFFEKAIPNFIDQGRFASYLVTVSSHMPYKYSSPTGQEYFSMFKDTGLSTHVKRYLSKIKYVDLALEYLLKTLEESGKLDDTVIVLFGDHYPYGLSDKDYAALAPYDTEPNQEVDRTPFIIYNSETEPEKIEKYTTPLDYAPTLLNLFGIDFDPRYYMGHDIYSDYTDYVVYADNSWQNASGFYNASKGEFIPTEGADVLTDEDIMRINTEVNDMRNMSGLAIKKNYFNYLFKFFEEYQELKIKKEEEEKNDRVKDLQETEDETIV